MEAVLFLLFGILIMVRNQEKSYQVATGAVLIILSLLMFGYLHLPGVR